MLYARKMVLLEFLGPGAIHEKQASYALGIELKVNRKQILGIHELQFFVP